MPSDSRNKLLLVAVAAAVFLSAFFKIADLDFWWHLKTGQILWQQKAFPYTEIYSFTANGRVYIDHEWLFQVIAYFFFSLAGPAGVILLKCAVLMLTYLLIARSLLQKGASPGTTFAVILLSVCGARIRFIERPEVFSVLYLVLIYLALDYSLRGEKRKIIFVVPALIVLWVNTHAAVILGLLLQFTFLAGLLAERSFPKLGLMAHYKPTTANLFVLAGVLILSILATGINPYGFRVLKVPFELTSIIDSGLLHNQEWQRPGLANAPFFFLCLGFGFVTMLVNIRRFHSVNLVFGFFLAFISLRYIRNVGLFCMFMPLLVSPFAESLSRRRTAGRVTVVVLSLLLAATIRSSPYEWGIGEASYFPKQVVAFTKSQDLQGNMINSYGFGGYLIWNLYPERKIFIDGRNEVFLPLLKELISMRNDNIHWNQLLERYQIEYALLNYVDDLETVTRIDSSGHSSVAQASFTSTHFPKSRWALIYWDDDGMVFIRRNGINQRLLNMEYASSYPEGRGYQEMLARSGRLDVKQSIRELERKLAEEPGCLRAGALLQTMKEIEAR
jgi:hypothetical protein